MNSESIMNIILDFEEERVVKAPTDFSGESSKSWILPISPKLIRQPSSKS